jgi:hypothetical protein
MSFGVLEVGQVMGCVRGGLTLEGEQALSEVEESAWEIVHWSQKRQVGDERLRLEIVAGVEVKQSLMGRGTRERRDGAGGTVETLQMQ